MTSQQQDTKELLIIDTDCGTDDALAILLAIGVEKYNVLGITCVAGNASIEQVCSNVLRVLKIGRRENVRRHLCKYNFVLFSVVFAHV